MVGRIVCSKAGRDKGYFMVVVKQENGFLYVCDGKERPLEHPKRKNEKHLQFISGAVYAQYIIVNVASIILIVCGVLFGALFDMVAGEPDFMTELTLQLEGYGLSLETIPQILIDILGWFLGGLFIFIGVIALVFNILMIKKIHRFAKSVYMGIMYQNTDFESPRTVRNWFIFMAVCSGITVVGSIASGPIVLISNACTLAITIMVIILLDKYFVKQN